MIILGHSLISTISLYHITEIEDIEKTPPNGVVYLDFDKKNLDIISFLQKNAVSYALEVSSIKEVLFANAMGATYSVVRETFAKTAQQIAETYLFDMKIIVHVSSEENMEEMALLGIDGVVFPSGIVKIS